MDICLRINKREGFYMKYLKYIVAIIAILVCIIIFGLNINTKPNIIYTIPSISSKLNALNSFGLEK